MYVRTSFLWEKYPDDQSKDDKFSSSPSTTVFSDSQAQSSGATDPFNVMLSKIQLSANPEVHRKHLRRYDGRMCLITFFDLRAVSVVH